MDERIALIDFEMPETMGVGYLGATFDARGGLHAAQAERDEMIERRILRVEMALRRAGIEVESVELPRVG